MATARPYQLELFEKALTGNVIACVPTGGGKTFISILLLKETAAQRRRKVEENCLFAAGFISCHEVKAKLAIFLVNTVPLVIQQAGAIRLTTDEEVGEYYGDLVESWNKQMWEKEF